MPQNISKIKDDLQVVFLLSCFEGHTIPALDPNCSNLDFLLAGSANGSNILATIAFLFSALST